MREPGDLESTGQMDGLVCQGGGFPRNWWAVQLQTPRKLTYSEEISNYQDRSSVDLVFRQVSVIGAILAPWNVPP